MESLRKVEVNRHHLNPCGHKGCLSFPRNTLLFPDRCEAAPRNGALENPFLWKLGRYWGIGLRTWSQVKEFFSGSDCSSPVGLDRSSLAVVLRLWGEVVPQRGGWPSVSNSLFCNHADGLSFCLSQSLVQGSIVPSNMSVS